MEVELSRACDFRCAYCHLGERPAPEEELSEREICDVILQGRDLGARRDQPRRRGADKLTRMSWR